MDANSSVIHPYFHDRVWNELAHRLDVKKDTRGIHITLCILTECFMNRKCHHLCVTSITIPHGIVFIYLYKENLSLQEKLIWKMNKYTFFKYQLCVANTYGVFVLNNILNSKQCRMTFNIYYVHYRLYKTLYRYIRYIRIYACP